MSKLEIITTKDFDECFKFFGYEELVRKVLHKCADKKEYGLVEKITLFDAEPSKRIFFENESGQEFTVRYFLQDETPKTWSAGYILYVGGEQISRGYAVTHYVNDDVAIQ